jgi:hypothetical protein
MNKTKYIWSNCTVAFALISIAIFFSFCLPIKSLLNFYVDDGFFYLKIAKNFSCGLGSSFDSISITNGYHPLWLIILTFIFYLIRFFVNNPSPETFLRISTLSIFIFICLSNFFIYKSFKLLCPKKTISMLIVFIALTLTPIFSRNFGLEMHAAIFFLSVFFWIKCREIVMKLDLLKSKILILSLLGITRIDFFFSLIPIIILFDSYVVNKKEYIKYCLKYSAPVIFVVIAYFSINYYYFEHIFPISSTIKNTFPSFNINKNIEHINYYIYQKSFNLSNLIAILLNFIILGFIILSKKIDDFFKIERVLFYICFGFIVFFIINFMFNIEFMQEWYCMCPVFISALAFTIIIRKKNWAIYGISVVFFIISAFYIYNARINANKFLSLYNYSKELNRLVHEDDEILQIDYSGIIGFFSDRKVINGDGLVNSFEYYEYYKSARLIDFINKYHIDYYNTCTAIIDSSTGLVYETVNPAWGKCKFTFSTQKIVLCRLQYFDSFQFATKKEWLLISLN